MDIKQSVSSYRLYLVIGALLLLVLVSVRWMLADIYAYQSQRIVDRWANGDPVIEAEWLSAKEYLDSALLQDPSHPDYLEDMAQLYHWTILQQGLSGDKLRRNLAIASDFYQQAIQRRPAWPYAWANYALAKAQLRDWDDSFRHALRQAIQLGPWEPAVQKAVVEAGLISWRELDSNDQALVVESFIHGFSVNDRRHAEYLLQMSERYGYLKGFCFLVQRQRPNQYNKVKKDCEK